VWDALPRTEGKVDRISGSEKLRHWILAYCPSTQEEVVGSGWYQEFSVADGQASWWRCPACCGWHVLHWQWSGGGHTGSEESMV